MAAAERQLADVEAALTRLTTAVAAGGDVPALVEAIKAHEGQRVALERRLEALRRPPVTFDAALERRLQTAVAEWRNVLGAARGTGAADRRQAPRGPADLRA